MITQKNDNKQEPFISIKALEKQIESVRQKMIECQNIKGFHDEETIKISQQLDDLIVQYQRKRKET